MVRLTIALDLVDLKNHAYGNCGQDLTLLR